MRVFVGKQDVRAKKLVATPVERFGGQSPCEHIGHESYEFAV